MIGQKLLYVERVDSTNNFVATLVSEGKIGHGAAILAGHQTQGRGQRGAVWEAEPFQNLLYSIWVEHRLVAVDRQFALTQAVCIALWKLLKSLGIESEIKWPNDMLVGSAKLAGVLIENQLSGQMIKGSIIGIGMNLNQQQFGEFNATSLKLLTGQHYDAHQVALLLAVELDAAYRVFATGQDQLLKQEYEAHLWLKDKTAQLVDDQGAFDGVIEGVEPDGQLRVLRNGVVRWYRHGDLRFPDRDKKV